MTQTYAISKAFAIGMVMEILWMCCHHCWLSRFPLANWSPWLEWSSRSRELSDLKPTKTNHSSNQTSWYSVIHFPYYNINFYSTNLRMQNSETQLHIKVIPPDPEVIVLVRWGSNVKEQHTTYSYNSPFYVCLYMMIGGLCGNLELIVTVFAYLYISV